MKSEKEDVRNHTLSRLGWLNLHGPVTLFYVFFVGMFLLSLVPSFEIWMLLKPETVYEASLVLAAALALASISFHLVAFLFQCAAYPRPRESIPWSNALFVVYTTVCWSTQRWAFAHLLWGTPFYGLVAKLMGATVEGRFLYFGDQLLDFPFLTIADRTILDGVNGIGHYVVFSEVALGPNHLSGLHHEGTATFANAKTVTEESGPWRPFLRQSPNHPMQSPNCHFESPTVPVGSSD